MFWGRIYNGANSPNGFLKPAVAYLCTLGVQCLLFSNRLTHRLWEVPEFQKVGHMTRLTPCSPKFAFFFVRSPSGQFVCQIWSFYLQPFPRYAEGPKILKEGHVTLSRPIFNLFCIFSLGPPVANLEIWRGLQNSRSRSRDPIKTPFDLILHYVV